METTSVLNDHYNAQTIFHLSDIHIRLYQRLHDEYEHVFGQFYGVLRACKDPSLIVITGDILHSKNDLSPECVLTTLKFLNTLSSFYPTLFIAGNHDALLNNPDRIDSLSAILAENKNPNLHYLKYSGFYRYGNIVFGVSSLLDGKMTTLPPDHGYDNQTTKVALYHGGVGKFSTNKGFVMEGIPVRTFDGYDMVMLGDIHLYQTLDKDKRVTYAGSMIAQNFGETDPHHGFIRWCIPTRQHTFIPIRNPYRYCEATLHNGILSLDGTDTPVADAVLPTNCRLKLLLHKTHTANDTQNIRLLQSKHPHAQVCVKIIPPITTNDTNDTNDTSIPETTTNDLLHDYFKSLPKSWEKEKIYAIVAKCFKEDTTKASHFEIHRVEFSRMFGYGPDNHIDFTQFQPNQTIGVFGENSAGKSTLIEIILFLLFGTITRYKHGQGVPHEVIHFQQEKSSGMIRFRAHGVVYEVSKKMTRTKTKIRVEEKIHILQPNGTRADLTAEHRKKTDKFVASQIGTPAQFLFTNVFLQSNEQSFRSMTPKDRKEFLYEILGLTQLEEHYQENASVFKQNSHTLTLLEEELRALPTRPDGLLATTRDTLRQLTKKQKELHTALDQCQQRIRTLLSSKKHCPFVSADEAEERIQSSRKHAASLRQEKTQLEGILPSNTQRDALLCLVEEACKRLRPVPPTPDTTFFSNVRHGPTPADATSFRQDAYDAFMSAPPPPTTTTDKEALLSSLYPDTPDEGTPVEKTGDDPDTLREELRSKEEELTHLRGQDPLQFASQLRFDDARCASCAHNKEMTQKYCGKKKTKNLQEAIRDLRARIVHTEAYEKWRRVAHNRSIREQLGRAQQEEQVARRYEKAKEAWAVLRTLHDAKAHNRALEEEIRRNKEALTALGRHKEVVVGLMRQEEKIAEMEVWQSNLGHNLAIDKQVACEEQKERRLKEELRMNTEECADTRQKAARMEEQEEARRKLTERHAKVQKENEFLDQLLKVLHRDGLPLRLLEGHLPQIEARINELIAPFLHDRRVALRKEEKKDNILLSVETLGRDTVYLGGMEGFIVDASIKEALAEVSSQSKSNLFIIDEGVSALDKRHMENLDQFFQFLEERHKHVLVISHLNEVRHMTRQSISVVKEGTQSALVFS